MAPLRVARGDGRNAGFPTHQASTLQTIKAQMSELKKARVRHPTPSLFQSRRRCAVGVMIPASSVIAAALSIE
jgi:hypothetical protein